MRRHRLESTITIRRPAQDVWDLMTDLFQAPRMRGMTLAARLVTPGPIGLGSIMEQRTKILGFETHFRFTVVEWDPPHALGASLSGAVVRSGQMRVVLVAVPDGTRQVTTFEAELTTPGILLWPVLGPLARRNLVKNDGREKALLEASPSDTVAG